MALFFKRAQYDAPAPGANGQVTTVAARPQPLEASRAAPRRRPRDARLQDHGRAAPHHRPDRPGPRAQGHPVRRQHQEPRLQYLRAGSAGLRQDHRREGPPRPEGRRGSHARRLGLRLQLRQPQPPARAAAPAWPRQGARQRHGRRARRAQKRPAGPVRERGLPGPPARHRRAVPVGPGGGARGAQPQGAEPEHRHPAHAHRLHHGADARGQGGQARGVQRAARGHAQGRREQDRGPAEGARERSSSACPRPTRSGARS